MKKVVLGVDPHKRVNAVAVVDTNGALVARQSFPNTTDGFAQLRTFARRWRSRTWAVEGCNGVGKHLAQRLVAAGETVLDVSTRRASLVRVFAGGNGRKNDDVDAEAVALVGLRTPGLPEVGRDDRTVALRLLSNRRAELVAMRTQAVCRIHRDLVALLPGGAPRALTVSKARELLKKVRPRDEVGRLRRQLIVTQIADLAAIDRRLAESDRAIRELVGDTPTTLAGLFGVGPVTIARVLGEVGDVARFRSRHHFASYNGTAPVDASSGGEPAYRLNTKGNRKLNHAIHMVAITQIRNDCPGRAYYLRKQAEGKTRKEALRALKRKISDAIYRSLVVDAESKAGPGGQVGTTPKASVTSPTPTAGTSVKPQPGPERKATPIAASA